MDASSQSRRFFVVATILAFFLGSIVCPDVYAANKTKPQPTSPSGSSNTVMVNAVDAASQQVTLLFKSDSRKVKYTVDGGTRITVQGNSATLDQVHSGQEVYSYVERDSTTLDSLDVGPVRSSK